MAKISARKLRLEGRSIKKIASELEVSRSSVSFWVRDIILTEEQLMLLKQAELTGKEKGRIKSFLMQKQRRIEITNKYKTEGITEVSTLNNRELLLVGLALYWAEGGKSSRNRRVEFCNSDPLMIKFLTLWLKNCFGVKDEELRAVVGINQIHSSREEVVKAYWAEVSGIPLSQFRKTSFKKVINTKVYDNFENHYGTLSILVTKSTQTYYKIMGLISGLSMAA